MLIMKFLGAVLNSRWAPVEFYLTTRVPLKTFCTHKWRPLERNRRGANFFKRHARGCGVENAAASFLRAPEILPGTHLHFLWGKTIAIKTITYDEWHTFCSVLVFSFFSRHWTHFWIKKSWPTVKNIEFSLWWAKYLIF